MAKSSSLQSALQPHLLSLLRLVAGLLFMEHGTAKLFGFPHAPGAHTVALFSLFGLAGVIEAFGGLLVAIGLFTRPAAFIMSGEMAFAYFMVHFQHSFFPLLSGGDAAVLYCFIFLYISLVGGGAWSLDRFRER
jgi:putative oxidoreductase